MKIVVVITCLVVVAGVGLYAFNSMDEARRRDCEMRLRDNGGYVTGRDCDDVSSLVEQSRALRRQIDALSNR